MARHISRRGFVKSSLFATAAIPLALTTEGAGMPSAESSKASAEPSNSLQTGWIGNQEFSRLMIGGNLISGYAHSRDLPYVSTLMRRYNTPAKIRETLELAERNGVTAINTWVQDDNSAIFDHWKNGGRMKWIAQTRLDGSGGFSQIQRAINEGAVGVHLTGDTCEGLLDRGQFERVAQSIAFIRQRKVIAGIGAHDLRVIVESERLKLDPDFYQKSLHTHDYFTAPKDSGPAVGANDNSWCSDPDAVVEVFSKISKPFIAFKILAAGAIPPRAAFPYAFTSGADFILVGMFDWQVEENCNLARRVIRVVSGPNSKRIRAWHGSAPT